MADMDRIDLLIQGHIAGDLDAAGRAELQRWLAEERDHRVRFLREVRFSEEIAQLAGEQSRMRAEIPAGRQPGPDTSTARSLRRRRLTLDQRRTTRTRRFAGWCALAACLLLGTGIALVSARAGATSFVILRQGMALTTTGQSLQAGDLLTRGEMAHLRDGASLTWIDGSLIEATAHTAVTWDDNTLSLQSGRVVASMRPQTPGHPFEVRTPHARVVVVGTRFSVSIEQGHTIVSVDEGHVRVFPQAAAEKMLGPGENLRTDGMAVAVGRTWRVAPTGTSVSGETFGSVADALAKAQAGDIIQLLPGRHVPVPPRGANASVVINRSGTRDAPITLRGDPGAILVGSTWNTVQVNDASWIDLISLRIVPDETRPDRKAGNGISIDRSLHVRVRECVVRDVDGIGIVAARSDHLLIAGNLIEGCGAGPSGTAGGITISNPRLVDQQEGPHIRITSNRVLRSQVKFPNHDKPDQWTGGHGILVHGTLTGSGTSGILIDHNLVSRCDGVGIALTQVPGIAVVENLVHANGMHPKHNGGDLQLYAPNAVIRGNLVVSTGKRTWVTRREDAAARIGNQVWEVNGAALADVAPDERLASSPFITSVAAEGQRTDFRLSGRQVGPALPVDVESIDVPGAR